MIKPDKEFAEDPQKRALQLMKRILVHFRGQLDEQLRPQGITTAQLSILYAIDKAPESSGAELARFCHITPQTAQTLIQRAEKSGWITRGKSAQNDRILTASLTAAGRLRVKKAEQEMALIQKKLWARVPKAELNQLNRLLEHCLGNITTDET